MNDELTISPSETDEDRRGQKGPLRRCIACGHSVDKSNLVRFVKGPSGDVVPDVSEKLPGRGVWVCAHKTSLDNAISSGGFKRALKMNIQVDDSLTALTESLLRRRVLSLMTMALKGGQMYIGFDQVKSAAQTDPLGFRIEASDGAEGGRGKIRVLTKAVCKELERTPTPVIGCFSAAELGQAFGRDELVHGALKSGPMTKVFRHAAQRLAGFSDLVPGSWPDKSHEEGNISTFPCPDKG